MEPEEEAFLNAILLEPDAPLPKGVYADWLEERGHADRSQYLRGRMRSVEFSFGPPNPPELIERQQTLRASLAPDWVTIIDGSNLIHRRIQNDWGHQAAIEVLWGLAGERNVTLLDGFRFVAPFGLDGFFQEARAQDLSSVLNGGRCRLGFTRAEVAGQLTVLGHRVIEGQRPLVALSHPTALLRDFFQAQPASGRRRDRMWTSYEWHRITSDWSVVCCTA